MGNARWFLVCFYGIRASMFPAAYIQHQVVKFYCDPDDDRKVDHIEDHISKLLGEMGGTCNYAIIAEVPQDFELLPVGVTKENVLKLPIFRVMWPEDPDTPDLPPGHDSTPGSDPASGAPPDRV